VFVVAVAKKLLAKQTATVNSSTVIFSRDKPEGFHLERPTCHVGSDHERNDQKTAITSNLPLLIENVPEEMQDFLEVALEDQAGGTITSFKPDKQLGGILVTFDQREGMYY
jgi:hypothetical protein